MFFGKLRKSPFPSLEKYLENQSKISVFYGSLGTWYEHFAVGLGQPILVSRFLRVIPRGVCWKIPSKFITLHAKKLRKQSKIIDFYGTLGTWYEPFSVSLGQPNLVSSFLRTISRGVCRKVSKKSTSLPGKILRKTEKICDFHSTLGTWYEHMAVGLGQPNFASSFLRTIPRGVCRKIPKNYIPHPGKILWKTIKNLRFLLCTWYMIWTLCSWLGATKFSICCIPILIFVPLPEKKHHINIWKWTICMFIVYIMCSWLTAAKFGSNNFSWTKRKQIHIKKPAAEKGSPQNEKA